MLAMSSKTKRRKIGFALPPLDHPGGVVPAVMTLTETLRAMGHEVHLFTFGKQQISQDRYHHPINDTPLKEQYNQFKHAYTRENTKKAFDLFVANNLRTHKLCLNSSVKNLYCCFHQSGPIYRGRFYVWRKRYSMRARYRGSKIIVISKLYGETLLRTYGISPAEFHIIPNGFNFQRIKQLAAQPPPQNWHPYLLTAGRLVPNKRVGQLIKDFAPLAARYALVVLGEGNEKMKLMALAQELKIAARVHFIGWEKNPYPWVKQARLVVTASMREVLPSTLIEALILGVPIVSTDNLGAREVMTHAGLQRYLAAPGKHFTAKMEEALNQYPALDPALLNRYDNKKIAHHYLALCAFIATSSTNKNELKNRLSPAQE